MLMGRVGRGPHRSSQAAWDLSIPDLKQELRRNGMKVAARARWLLALPSPHFRPCQVGGTKAVLVERVSEAKA